MLPSLNDYLNISNNSNLQIILPSMLQYQTPAVNHLPIGSQLNITLKKSDNELSLEAFIFFQPENYYINEKHSPQITNPIISEAWKNLFRMYFDACDFHVVLHNQIDEKNELIPYHSIFCCKKKNIFFHPPCPSCGNLLEICEDNSLLASHHLNGYSTSTQRFLYCPSCIDEQVSFYSVSPDNISSPLVKGKWELIREYLDVTRHNDLDTELPCKNCTELDSCFKQHTPEIIPFSFYPFYMMLFDITKMTHLDYLKLISGINFIPSGQHIEKNALYNLLKVNSPVSFFFEKNADCLFKFQNSKNLNEQTKESPTLSTKDSQCIFLIIDRIYQQKNKNDKVDALLLDEVDEESSEIPPTVYDYESDSSEDHIEKDFNQKTDTFNLSAIKSHIIELYFRYLPEPDIAIIEYIDSKGISNNNLRKLKNEFYVTEKKSTSIEIPFFQKYLSEIMERDISQDHHFFTESSFTRLIDIQRLIFDEMDRIVEAIRKNYGEFLKKKEIKQLFFKFIIDEIDTLAVKEYFDSIINLFKFIPEAYNKAILEEFKELLDDLTPDIRLGTLSFFKKLTIYDNYKEKIIFYQKILKTGKFVEEITKKYDIHLLKAIEYNGGT